MKILMVCLGNICRSPLAEGIMQKKIEDQGLDWQVDSAGTSGWHQGELPDPRSIEKAQQHGLDITYQRSRQLLSSDLEDFDLILAMDTSNYNNIKKLDSENIHSDKIKMILNFVYPNENRSVPDPYYDNGFQRVYDMLDQATEAILNQYS